MRGAVPTESVYLISPAHPHPFNSLAMGLRTAAIFGQCLAAWPRASGAGFQAQSPSLAAIVSEVFSKQQQKVTWECS